MSLSSFARLQLAPPRYLAPAYAGIDISASTIKVATIREHAHGLELEHYGEERLPAGAIQKGEISDRTAVAHALSVLAERFHIQAANITLPESRGYLFEADVPGATPADWRLAVEQRLAEFIPLPPQDVAFDISPLRAEGVAPLSTTHVVGVGYARRVVDASLAAFTEAGIAVGAVEGEVFSAPRALLPLGETETVLIIDIGKTTTKVVIATGRLPRFATTLDVGGHALTLAVQKHFGVTEEEAKRVKAERGIVAGVETDEYLSAMLSTISVIREEIVRRLDYWQSRASSLTHHAPVTRGIIIGGNATVRGLPEYLSASLKIQIEQGDVFRSFAPRTAWLPPLDYTESLAYGTAIGLALRNYAH